MKELSLQEIKQIELDILKEFHSFCVKNNIRYFLAYGTLLGAVRYKKFIPWDDDVDVLVPREDYDRLIALFEDSDRFCLYSYERNRKYQFPFAKLCDKTTYLEEIVYPNKGVRLGVNIDIFPLDAWDNNIDNARKEVKRINKNMMWLGVTKLNSPLTRNKLKRFAWWFVMGFVKMLGSGFFIRRIIDESNKPEQYGSSYLGVKVWCLYGDRGIVPAEIFSEAIELEFEGEKFFAPIGYDAFLTSLYGDYLPEPPVEKRKTHHSFKAYRL